MRTGVARLADEPSTDAFLGHVLLELISQLDAHNSALFLYDATDDSLRMHFQARAGGALQRPDSGDEDIYRSLQAGAEGYLLKDSPRQETLRAIRAVAAGEDVLPPALALKIAKRVGKGSELTTRECEVLTYLAKGKSNKEIGTILFVCEGTIKAHVNNILAKLGASGRTEAVTLAIKRGLIRLP